MNLISTEEARLLLQLQLDEAKSKTERNKSGQFATPQNLASDILQYAKVLFSPNDKIRFLDPAFGTGSFYSALLQTFPSLQISTATGYEIDPHYANEALSLWSHTPLQLKVADFTQSIPPIFEQEKANLIVCNPPYIRHHHLTPSEKLRLQNKAFQLTGIKLSQLASFYSYFLCISDAWMAKDCLAAWLIPNGFMDVNYGRQIQHYLLNQVTLLVVHQFPANELQFQDALVSSTVIWFKKALPPTNHCVEFSYGNSLTTPDNKKYISIELLRQQYKWTRFFQVSNEMPSNLKEFCLKDLFAIKRGLATGANHFFVLTKQQVAELQIPREFIQPILPSPRYLVADEVASDLTGDPILKEQLFLLDCHLSMSEVKAQYLLLWQYLQMGIKTGVSDRYLCKHRSPWYSQEKRLPAPFLCTYMGRQDSSRGKPFRFILNHSKAIVTNTYLNLYPKPPLGQALLTNPNLMQQVWKSLNQISTETLIGEGRVYGGGLHKLEPKELGNALVKFIMDITCIEFSLKKT